MTFAFQGRKVLTALPGYTYDDVLIFPRYSDIESRSEIDVAADFLDRKTYPIVSAPMDTVSGREMVLSMADYGAYGILHRFGTQEELKGNLAFVSEYTAGPYGFSIGVKNLGDTEDLLEYALGLKNPPDSVTIDVAHGEHKLVVDMIKFIRRNYNIKIIAGNVATGIGFERLSKAEPDAIRVGIGPGSACTTRENTGVGVPQLTALEECVRVRRSNKTPYIIADGGIQKPGDIAKALAVGADVVMLGRLLAGADEAPEGTHYRGQSSVGINASRGAPEGVEGLVEPTGPVADTLSSLMHYLRSSMSYVGARNLEEFREKAQFVLASPGTRLETTARI